MKYCSGSNRNLMKAIGTLDILICKKIHQSFGLVNFIFAIEFFDGIPVIVDLQFF